MTDDMIRVDILVCRTLRKLMLRTLLHEKEVSKFR